VTVFNPTGWHPITWTEWAMNEAAGRLGDAYWHDPHVAYAAAGETLFWVCALDDVLKKRMDQSWYLRARRENFVDDAIKGMRHARNRFAHDLQVLEYVEVAEVGGDGGYEQLTLWRWRQLPPADTEWARRGEVEYRYSLEGKEVNSTVQMVCNFLRGISRLAVNEDQTDDGGAALSGCPASPGP
jgi:hypothetical protein